MLAAMATISGGSNDIQLPLCPDSPTKLVSRPVEFTTPVSYNDDDVKEPSEELVSGAGDAAEAVRDEQEEESEGE